MQFNLKQLKEKIPIIISLFLVLIMVLSFYFYYYEPRTWGDDGELTLSLTADRTSMNITGSINFTLTFHNTGDTDLRILPPTVWSRMQYHVQLYDSNGTRVEDHCDHMDRPLMDNSDLITLRSGAHRSYVWEVNQDKYDLKINETYSVLGQYHVKDEEDITLPFWQDEIVTNEIHFQVDP